MATPPSSGADQLANALLASLVAGKEFTIPDVAIDKDLFAQPPGTGPLFEPIQPVTLPELTSGTVDGNGVFDVLMRAVSAHLKVEYDKNRMSGADYSKAYAAMGTSVLQVAAQFLLGKDTARWQALIAQQQAQAAEIEKVKARIELETARFQFVRVRFDALTAETGYALTKLKLASEDATFANLLKQGMILDLQVEIGELDKATKTFTNQFILPLQRELLSEQVEVQRAQTLDVRRDGTVIVGSVGKQKELYSQQITSYKRDSEVKFVKFYTDAFIAMKTIDEGLQPPPEFQNVNLDSMLKKGRANVGLA